MDAIRESVFSTRVSPEAAKKFKEICNKKGLKLQWVMEQLIKMYADDKEIQNAISKI